MVQTIKIRSVALGTDIMINVIRPKDENVSNLMILLHGNMSTESSEELFFKIPKELKLQDICDEFHIMIVIPLMRNRYYISTKDYDCDRFVAHELPDHIKQIYSLSKSVEMILAGISMGGYGATLIASRTGIFMKVISISGAYIVNDVEIGNSEVWGGLTPYSIGSDNSFLYYFLPLTNLKDSIDRNAFAAIRLFAPRNDNPKFVVTCGTEDWLYERNLDFLKVLNNFNINYAFIKIVDRGHDPECFKIGLWNSMEYLFD